MGALPIEDMSKTYLEHSMVIHNFVIKVGNQIKDSLCRVFGDSVQYQWHENDDKVVIPDVSIICNMRDRKNVSFTGIPRFVMEVLSDATEDYDRNEKMDIYRKVGVGTVINRIKMACNTIDKLNVYTNEELVAAGYKPKEPLSNTKDYIQKNKITIINQAIERNITHELEGLKTTKGKLNSVC